MSEETKIPTNKLDAFGKEIHVGDIVITMNTYNPRLVVGVVSGLTDKTVVVHAVTTPKTSLFCWGGTTNHKKLAVVNDEWVLGLDQNSVTLLKSTQLLLRQNRFKELPHNGYIEIAHLNALLQ